MSRLASFQVRLLFMAVVIVVAVLAGMGASRGAPADWANGFRPVDTAVFGKWAAVNAAYRDESRRLTEAGAVRQDPAARAFEALIRTAATRSSMAKLTMVNAFYNRLTYRSDRASHGADTWLAPYGLILAGAGDCEDFAIAKLFTLLRLGFASESLHLVVVRDVAKNRPHAILAIEHAGIIWVLDSQAKTVMAWDRAMADYKPLYAVGSAATGIYRGAS